MADLRVLVVGDLVLDEWLRGAPRRVCREGPVPVVEVADVRRAAGQVGNTAANAAGLGADVRCVALVGDDRHGGELGRVLQEGGADVSGLVVDRQRPTPVKRRLVADGQMVARFDEQPGTWSEESVLELEERALARLDDADVVIVSDYAGGALTRRFRSRLAEERRRITGPLVVDAEDVARWRSCRPTAVTPNAGQVQRILGEGHSWSTSPLTVVREAGDLLRERTGAELVVTTVDAQGSLLHRSDGSQHRTHPSVEAAPLGACGAGDTFTATFALALAAGATPERSADLGQKAADCVVVRSGTTVCRADDLRRAAAASRRQPTTIASLDALAERIGQHRLAGHRVVFTNGCFDILHSGHVSYLEQASGLGDVLVVGVNSDASVRRLKGPDRPVIGEGERARLVGSLEPVDIVVVFDEDTPRQVIECLRPDVYVKGGDYIAQMLPEADLVRSLGGEIAFVEYVEDASTTGIVHRIRRGVSV